MNDFHIQPAEPPLLRIQPVEPPIDRIRPPLAPPIEILPYPPRGCFPPCEPEPGPEDLGKPIDWMTYSHQELYGMATNGLDLAGANAVAAKWADLGAQLSDIADSLAKAVRQAQSGWEGPAAEMAKETARRLANWSRFSGHRAHEASGCVSRQAEIAQRTHNEMPEPVMTLPDPICDLPLPRPPFMPYAQDAGATSAMSASGFEGGARIIANPGPDQDFAQARHRQAADVMERMQRESHEVYGTVPQFRELKTPVVPPDNEPPDDGDPRPKDKGGNDDQTDGSTNTSGIGDRGPGVGAPITGGPIGGSSGGPVSGGGPGGPGQTGLSPGGQSGVASGSGAAASGPAAGGAAAAAASGGGARGMGGGMMGGGMMGGGAGAGGGNDDKSHQRSSPLYGESGLFEPDEATVDGVIGDPDNPRRRER